MAVYGKRFWPWRWRKADDLDDVDEVLTSDQLRSFVSDETGSGALVFGTAPTLGTPAIADFTNAQHDHQDAADGGTLDAAAITSGTLPVARGGTGNTTGTATVNANLTGPITSVGNATAIASQTGTGTKFVVQTNPALVGPTTDTLQTSGRVGIGVAPPGATIWQQIFGGASTATRVRIGGNGSANNLAVNITLDATTGLLTIEEGTGPSTIFSLTQAGKVTVFKSTVFPNKPLTLSNGANNDLAIADAGFVRITGPTGAFSVSGFAAGTDGQVLVIFNTTAQQMTLKNLLTSTAANQIQTLTGADIVLRAGTSSASFIYDGGLSKWIVTATN